MPLIDHFTPESKSIAEELERLSPNHRAYLLKNHGPVVTGKDLSDACDHAEELEETAKLMFILKGSEVRYFTSEEIKILEGMKK